MRAGLIAGCGVTLNSGALRGQDGALGGASPETAIQREAQSLGFPSTGAGGSPHQFLRRGAAKLGLTDEQKAQLKKIAQAHTGDRAQHRADFQKYRAELEAILLADKVDEEALRAFIAARKQEASAMAASGADTVAEMRAMLTEKQRNDLVALLQDQQTGKGVAARRKKLEEHVKPRLEAFRKSLGLTDEQSAAVDALQKKLQAIHADARPLLKQAAIAFIQTGDKAALAKAMQDGIAGRVPTDELVKVAAVLDKDQRTKLAAHFDQVGNRMKDRHQGPGKRGHGFMGTPGGAPGQE